MAVIEVGDKTQLRKFVFFPRDLYRSEPNWVPPIWFEERTAYSKKKNPILANSDFTLTLSLKNNRVQGRNLVYIDHSFNRHCRSSIGFFGGFECIDDPAPAAELMAFAEKWLKSRGMTAIRGPIHPVAENWGFLYRGYDTPPVFMSPYNPAYYHGLVTRHGYAKVKDLLVYEADAGKGYQIPPRFLDFYDRFLQRHPDFSIRKLNLRNLSAEAVDIWKLSNLAYRDNWGYVPLDVHVLEDMIRKLKMIVDTDAVWMAVHREEVVAYCLGFPDLNVILRKIRGRLFPLGFIRILRDIRSVRDYRLFGLAVHPRYQNLGLDALLYVHLARALSPRGIRLEANYILEDNHKIRNALEKLNLIPIKTYRIYEKKL